MDPSQSTSHSPHKEKCAPGLNKQSATPPQDDDTMYLGLHFDRRLAWHKHIFGKWKQLGITLTKM
jgi:hypothetical protein